MLDTFGRDFVQLYDSESVPRERVVNNRTHAGVPSSAQAVVDEIVHAGGTGIAESASSFAAGQQMNPEIYG